MSKKSHHFLTLWPWPLTYDLEKLIRSGHYHYQCVYQIWEQSIPWFLSYRVNTIAGGGRLRRKTITSPDPSDTGDIINWYRLVSNISCTSNIRRTPTLRNSQLEFSPTISLTKTSNTPRVLTLECWLLTKCEVGPTWSELLWVACRFWLTQDQWQLISLWRMWGILY